MTRLLLLRCPSATSTSRACCAVLFEPHRFERGGGEQFRLAVRHRSQHLALRTGQARPQLLELPPRRTQGFGLGRPNARFVQTRLPPEEVSDHCRALRVAGDAVCQRVGGFCRDRPAAGLEPPAHPIRHRLGGEG